MGVRSAVIIVAAVSLAAAGAVALASRAPAQLRDAVPGPAATDPDNGARFTELEVRRGAAYSRPSYAAFVAGAVVETVLLVVLTRGPWTRLVERVHGLPGGWVTQAALLGAVVAGLLWASALPLGYVRGYVVEHAWNLSTQGVAGWFGDRLRSLLVGGVMGALTALAFFAVVRWQPRTWWLWVWGVFTLLTAVLFFLWPVLIAPLFNTFRPLENSTLRSKIENLAQEAHVDLDEVLVADASRRTTAENAYVAGFAGTRRLVLYDTLLRAGKSDETLFVVGHELGHEVEHHVLRGLFLASGGLLLGSAVLAWLSTRDGLWHWAGASGVADLRALPLLLLFATVATLLTLPVQNAFSRRFEVTADRIAIRLTKDPATAIRVLRRLGLSNIADLRPPAIAVAVLYSHPPIPDRIERVRDFRSAEP